MKFLISLLLLLTAFSTPAVSLAQGSFTFLDAVSLCQDNDNPLVALYIASAHRFGEVTTTINTDGSTTFSVPAISTPHTLNQAILAPDTILGTIVVKMYYKKQQADMPLICELTFID